MGTPTHSTPKKKNTLLIAQKMTTIYLTILFHFIIEPLYYTFWEVHHDAHPYNISGNPFVKQTKRPINLNNSSNQITKIVSFILLRQHEIWKWFSFLALTCYYRQCDFNLFQIS
jgi:hypothetical protein